MLFLKYGVVALYFVVLVGLTLFGLHRWYLVYLYRRNRHRQHEAPSVFDPMPRVTVQLPVFNERYVVERLIRSIAAFDYPRDRLQIQVLDDSTDDTVEISRRVVAELAAAGVDIELRHRVNRQGFKAGALQEGLESATGEFVAVFDADFVPDPDFLQKTVHHFTDDAIGMVQVRWGHINSDYSLITRAQSIFLDGHFVVEHTARNWSGRFFNFNGTAGVWRRRAIEDAGGWEHDTLTEDLDLSYRAQLAGWKFAYILDVVAPGEVPVQVTSFKTQQHRWAKGSIETARKILPRMWKSDQPFGVKFEATMHLAGNVAYLLVLLLAVLTFPALMVRINMNWRSLAGIDALIFLSATIPIIIFYSYSQQVVTMHWKRRILYFPFLMALGIGLAVNNAKAVWEGLTGQKSEFKRTPKYRIEGRTDKWSGKTYQSLLSGTTWIELALTIYFLLPIAFAIYFEIYAAVPFLLLFLVGFGYVSLVSIYQARSGAPVAPRAA
jgi:cellulose synthase/poly-beta-1,6-N-acetylglucosamine synthase-like glycosyltransferase